MVLSSTLIHKFFPFMVYCEQAKNNIINIHFVVSYLFHWFFVALNLSFHFFFFFPFFNFSLMLERMDQRNVAFVFTPCNNIMRVHLLSVLLLVRIIKRLSLWTAKSWTIFIFHVDFCNEMILISMSAHTT